MSSPSLQPVIDLVFNGQVLESYPLNTDTLTIGRMRENDIVIDNLLVSRFHAKILKKDNKVFLEDQGSENGCFVNGKRIKESLEISDKDEAIIGKHKLVLRIPKVPAINLPNLPPLPKESGDGKAPSSAWDASSTFIADRATQEKIIKKIAEKLEQSTATDSSKPSETEKKSSSKDRQPDVALIISVPGRKEEIYYWTKTQMTLGRSMESDIVMDQPQVSRNHAVLQIEDGRHFIEDLDTGSGTYVNQNRIKKKELFNDDVILIGDNQILFKAPKIHRKDLDSETATIEIPNVSPIDEKPKTAVEEESLDDMLSETSSVRIEVEPSTTPPQESKIPLENFSTDENDITGRIAHSAPSEGHAIEVSEDLVPHDTLEEPAEAVAPAEVDEAPLDKAPEAENEGIWNESQTAGLPMFSSDEMDQKAMSSLKPVDQTENIRLEIEIDLSSLPKETQSALKTLFGEKQILPIGIRLKTPK